MAWLARLDARAAKWPKPVHWSYIGLKWYLASVGGIALLRVYLDRIGMWPFY